MNPEDSLKLDGWTTVTCAWCNGAGKGLDANNHFKICPECYGVGGFWRSPSGRLYIEGTNGLPGFRYTGNRTQ